ncbi:hypothetical protein [Bacillus subtilis]
MTDFERKLYQIFVNMSLYEKNPTLPELKRKTGKGEQERRTGNTRIHKKPYQKGSISWDKENKIWVL